MKTFLILLFIYQSILALDNNINENYWISFGTKQTLKKAIYFCDLEEIEIFLSEKKTTNAFIDLVYALNQYQAGLLNVSFYPNEIANLFIQYRVDINQLNYRSKSAIHIACQIHNLTALKLLITFQANLNIKDGNNKTPLMIASSTNFNFENNQESYIPIVNQLIQSNANLNDQDDLGNTALIYAVQFNKPKIVYLLLKNGADEKIINQENKTYLDYANDKPIVLALINEYKRQINELFLQTPLIPPLADIVNQY